MNSLGRFKSMVRKGLEPRQPLAPMVLRKPLVSHIEAMDNRLVKYTISTETVDRERDTVAVRGWELDIYKTNPVVLWGHQSHLLPIGRCVDIGVEGGALKAMVEFVPADMPVAGELAEAVLRMSRSNFLSATSVGFRPLSWEIAKDRDDDDSWFPPLNFTRQELMEFSIVSIPANPEALIDPDERTMPSAAMAPIAATMEAAATAAILTPEDTAHLAEVAARRRRRQLDARLIEIGR